MNKFKTIGDGSILKIDDQYQEDGETRAEERPVSLALVVVAC